MTKRRVWTAEEAINDILNFVEEKIMIAMTIWKI